MAITKQDCLTLLSSIQGDDQKIKEMSKKVMLQDDIPLDVVEFINNNRQFEVSKFYEKLRKAYNKKKSPQLYMSIMKSTEQNEPKDIIATLSSLGLQIILFSKNVDDPQMFLRQARYEEVASCLYHYSKTFDLVPAIKLLRLVKSDLKAFEYLNKKDKE